jgi:hypothetical protein
VLVELLLHKQLFEMSTTSPSLGPATLVVTWAGAGLGTVFFALRIYTHAFLTHRWKADFWWALLTYVSHSYFEGDRRFTLINCSYSP